MYKGSYIADKIYPSAANYSGTLIFCNFWKIKMLLLVIFALRCANCLRHYPRTQRTVKAFRGLIGTTLEYFKRFLDRKHILFHIYIVLLLQKLEEAVEQYSNERDEIVKERNELETQYFDYKIKATAEKESLSESYNENIQKLDK